MSKNAKNAGKIDYTRTKDFRNLRAALLDDLSARNLTGKQYADKVDEYMDFWRRRNELRDDVDKRGLTVRDARGSVVENRSVSLEIQVSRQMLAIFTALGFKADAIRDAASLAEDDL